MGPTFRAVLMTALLAAPAAADPSSFRLDGDVTPAHYGLALDLDVAGNAIVGEETIDLRLSRPLRSFRLHAVGLEIAAPRLRVGERELPLAVSVDAAHEMVELAAEEEIPAGAATLALSWRGALEEGLSGIYLSRVRGRWTIGSQMQATYARQAFPCFDEPSMKATFDLAVTLDASLTAISNGRLLREEPAGEGRKRVIFDTSPRMSTYLVALAAGDFACIESEVDGIPLRTCAAPDSLESVRWAHEVAERVLRFYNGWYGIRYPFGKLDMVAIPNYEWGGMENTGAIFYRESALLFDPATGSPDRRRRIADLVAHEVAHQWFGDLVTTAWWDDIWLNEGFASWIESKPVAAIRADWSRPEDGVAVTQRVLDLDALPTTRPIRGRAATPGEIKELFDGIAYTKGSAVIRMIEAFVGEEPFRRGVNAYLAKYANGNARSQDLWRAIAAASERPVDAIMETFVEQPGVPVLSFEVRPGEGATTIAVAQRRFFLDGVERDAAELWQVPACFRVGRPDGSSEERCELLAGRRAEWSVPGEVAWLVGNAGGRGYYRVSYGALQLESLGEVVSGLPAAERLALLADVWAGVESGRGGVDDFLALVERLDGERNRRVIGVVSSALGEIRRALVGASERGPFDAWVRERFAARAAELGPEPRAGEDDDDRSLRATYLGILAGAGDAASLERAREIVRRSLADRASVDPSLTGIAFRVAPEHGDAALFDTLVAALAAGPDPESQGRYLDALPRFEQPELVRRAIAYVDEGRVKIDEYPGYFGGLLDNRAARGPAWEYLKAHWGDLANKVTSFGGRGAVSALGSICSEELEADVRAFFADHDAPGAERALAQALERMAQCRGFRAAQGDPFTRWLAARPPG